MKQIRNLIMVDGAFHPHTDPAYNRCEESRDALAGTGVILHAHIAGDAEEVRAQVERVWKPGLKLIVGTHAQHAATQQQRYHAIHATCA